MAFFTRQDIGRVYVIRATLPDDTVLYKIGMVNSSRSVDRMMEILRSWFQAYRFVPYTELRLDRECSHPYQLEQFMHKVLARYQWVPSKKVDGGTEMFIGLDERRLLHYLRNFNEQNFTTPLELSDEQYQVIGKLLAHERS